MIGVILGVITLAAFAAMGYVLFNKFKADKEETAKEDAAVAATTETTN